VLRVSLHPPHSRRDLEPYCRHVLALARCCALGSRQGYVLSSVAMNGNQVPGGANDIVGGVHGSPRERHHQRCRSRLTEIRRALRQRCREVHEVSGDLIRFCGKVRELLGCCLLLLLLLLAFLPLAVLRCRCESAFYFRIGTVSTSHEYAPIAQSAPAVVSTPWYTMRLSGLISLPEL
jgi:hypothetical protein